MKRKVFGFSIMLLFATAAVFAQEFRVQKATGKLLFKEINDLTIEGHSGNEIIFSSLDGEVRKDKRAEGLRSINSMGLEDNTGLGLAVQDKGATVEVYQLKKMGGSKIKVLVPKGVTVSVSHSTPYGSGLRFRNLESEIEVSTVHQAVNLENITGPLTIKTVHGAIEAAFGQVVKSPVSLISVHGLIDITVPAALKASVNLSTTYGEIFVDPAIKIDLEDKNEEWVKYGSGKIKGKINGGGLDLTLGSTHSSIYVRKK